MGGGSRPREVGEALRHSAIASRGRLATGWAFVRLIATYDPNVLVLFLK
jgi:hypothetical protein